MRHLLVAAGRVYLSHQIFGAKFLEVVGGAARAVFRFSLAARGAVQRQAKTSA
jgi:hypothetical protein